MVRIFLCLKSLSADIEHGQHRWKMKTKNTRKAGLNFKETFFKVNGGQVNMCRTQRCAQGLPLFTESILFFIMKISSFTSHYRILKF